MKFINNNRLKTILFILFAMIAQVFLGLNGSVFAEEDKVYKFAGDNNHPPYEYLNKKGEFVGFNIDILEVIAKDQNINVEIIPMEWDKAVTSLEKGNIDGIIGMSKSREREKLFKFISPNLIVDQVIFSGSENVAINTLEDLEGLKVAYQLNDRNEEYISKIPNIIPVPKDDQESALLALSNKEVDAVLGTNLVGIYYLQKNNLINDIQVVGEAINSSEYGIVVTKENEELYKKLEKGLINIKTNKTYDKIYSKWFRESRVTIYEIIKSNKLETTVIVGAIVIMILFLTRYNSILKKRVKNRTKEIERANEELFQQQKEIYKLAYYDPVTSLPNRFKFIKELDKLLGRVKEGSLFAVLFLDLDRFKNINDTLGHETGDYILKLLSIRLRELMGEKDILAKVGGDEYFILYPYIKDREEIINLTNKIIENFKEPFTIDGYEIYLTTSIGIAIYPDSGIDSGSLLKNLDLALYKAKELGGNSYYIYGEELKSQGFDRMLLLNQLRQAVEENQLVVDYQPQVDIKTGKILGVEALMRWNHPEKGLLYPDAFIPLAEESGLIIAMGDWILKKACNDVKDWVNKRKDIYVSVNISTKQFQHKDFIKEVMEALDIAALNSRNLVLEITETVAISNIKYTIEILNELKELGIGVAIDDFGTGYSSLSYLSEMGANELKIDRSFISDIETNSKNKTISNAIIALAKKLDMKVTAEGVENLEQLTILKNMNCDKAQGYYFSRPISKEEIEKNYLDDFME